MIDWVHHPDGCVHPIHLFTKLGTLQLTKSRGFPAPYLAPSLRVPRLVQKTGVRGLHLPLKARTNRGMGALAN